MAASTCVFVEENSDMSTPTLENLMAAGHSRINAVKHLFKLNSDQRQFVQPLTHSPTASGDSSPLESAGDKTGKVLWNKAMRRLSKAGIVQKSVQAFLNKKEEAHPELVCMDLFCWRNIIYTAPGPLTALGEVIKHHVWEYHLQGNIM